MPIVACSDRLLASSAGLLDLFMEPAPPPPRKRRPGEPAVIELYGFLRRGFLARASDRLEVALLAPSVPAIVLDFDSWGGEVAGVPEFAAKVAAGKRRKEIVAVASANALGAAYWIASQASEVVVSPSGAVGGIGVADIHQDITGALAKEGVKVTHITGGEHKGERSPALALSKEARAFWQRQVDAVYRDFLAYVSRGRRVTLAEIRKGFGEGRDLLAREAVAAGAADRIGTLEQVIEDLSVEPDVPGSAGRGADEALLRAASARRRR